MARGTFKGVVSGEFEVTSEQERARSFGPPPLPPTKRQRASTTSLYARQALMGVMLLTARFTNTWLRWFGNCVFGTLALVVHVLARMATGALILEAMLGGSAKQLPRMLTIWLPPITDDEIKRLVGETRLSLGVGSKKTDSPQQAQPSMVTEPQPAGENACGPERGQLRGVVWKKDRQHDDTDSN